MFEEQPLEILWDDLIPIDLDKTANLNRLGLMPAPGAALAGKSTIPQTPFLIYVALGKLCIGGCISCFPEITRFARLPSATNWHGTT